MWPTKNTQSSNDIHKCISYRLNSKSRGSMYMCMINATNAPILAWIWTTTILLRKAALESHPVRIHNHVVYVSTLLGKLKENIEELSPRNQPYWGLVLTLRKRPQWYTVYFVAWFVFYLFIYFYAKAGAAYFTKWHFYDVSYPWVASPPVYSTSKSAIC